MSGQSCSDQRLRSESLIAVGGLRLCRWVLRGTDTDQDLSRFYPWGETGVPSRAASGRLCSRAPPLQLLSLMGAAEVAGTFPEESWSGEGQTPWGPPVLLPEGVEPAKCQEIEVWFLSR